MSTIGAKGSRRRRDRALRELLPEDDCASKIKQAIWGTKLEALDESEQDEAYVVVVKEEAIDQEEEDEQIEADYQKFEEPEYPDYNHDHPFFLHIPEVKLEYNEDMQGEEDGDVQSQNVMTWQPDQDFPHEDGFLSSEEPAERWICGKEPDEKQLLELMQAPPPPLPDPPPYYLEDEVFRCKLCNYEHTLEGACVRHYRQKHGPRYIYCFACGATFAQYACLYKHEMKNRCTAPGINVVRRLRLQMKTGRKRVRIVSRNPATKVTRAVSMCSQCGATLRTAQELKEHERNAHATFRRFRCEYCPMSYTMRTSLKSHLQTHASMSSICDYCGKSFIKRESLILHIRNHQGKRFKCSYCPKRFTQKRSLVAHEAQHTGAPPPHPCQFCNSGFWRLGFLKTHMEKVHGYSILSRKKFLDMMPHMTAEQIEDSISGGGGLVTFDSTSQSYKFGQMDSVSSVDERSPEDDQVEASSLGSIVEEKASSDVEGFTKMEETPKIEIYIGPKATSDDEESNAAQLPDPETVHKLNVSSDDEASSQKFFKVKIISNAKKSVRIQKSHEVQRSLGSEKSNELKKSLRLGKLIEAKKSADAEKSKAAAKSPTTKQSKAATLKSPRRFKINIS